MKSIGHGAPTAIDLFCGCGGLSVGLRRAGFRVLGAVDIDALSVETYQLNHRRTRVWRADVRSLDPDDLRQTLGIGAGELDLLAGCPPCQGFSTLRTLNGSRDVDDPRNDLLSEFARFVECLRPAGVMLENVPRLAEDVRFAVFRNRLAALGYIGRHEILDAADFGVPQRRRRLIYLAGRGEAIPFASKSRRTLVVRDVLHGIACPGKSGDRLHDFPEKRSARIRDLIRYIPKDGGSRSDLPPELRLRCHKSCDGFFDVYGRMRWARVAPTITSGCFNPSKGRFLHPEEDRAITLREAALIQGFPPSYRFSKNAGKESIAAMIGNALPPPFVAAHARAMRRALESDRGQRR